jgi:very-short-patch-repair endonuclease
MSNKNDELNQYAALHGETIKKEYEVEKKSIGLIAKEYGTYSQKIFRVLKKMGTNFRTKSEAQKVALEVGRSDHPTEGKRMSPEQKRNLGVAISASYENSSQEDKDRRSNVARKRYAEKTPEQRESLRRKANVGILESAQRGSKLERFLLDKLTQLGYNIVFHKKGFILNEHLEIDLLIPSMKVAIEVDGIFHTEDVWQNGSLEKVKNKDSEKNALLLMNGYVMIRLSNTAKSCSQYYMRERLDTLYKCLEEIKLNFPPIEKRLIYLGE